MPQPDYPGINAVSAGAGEALDPHFRPNVVDSFDLTIQRQLTKKVTMEFGYIGRRVTHEYQPINVNAVPYMMTIGGQRFDKAYANLVLQYCGGMAGLAGGNCAGNVSAVTAQPFFETALAGTGYCNVAGATNCTQAVAINEGNGGTTNLSSQNVWSLWSDLDNGGFNFSPQHDEHSSQLSDGTEIGCGGQLSSGVGINASIGYGNYNAGFVTVKMADWKGVTAQSNFTWSKALGTGSVVQATSADTPPIPSTSASCTANRRLIVSSSTPCSSFTSRRSSRDSRGSSGTCWVDGPLLLYSLPAADSRCRLVRLIPAVHYGEGDSNAFTANGNTENAVLIAPYTGGNSAHRTPGTLGFGDGGLPVNLFANPQAVYNNFRNPILGLDTKNYGWGVLTGLPYWNMDMSIKKDIRITERISTEFQVVFTNVLNHAQLLDPVGLGSCGSPGSFGNLPGEGNGTNNAGPYTPRSMEFGFRVRF